MSEELGFDTKGQARASPDKEVRRWLLEIKLASKREKDWREKARAIFDKYRGKDRKKNSFNILWANTEVLRPALYNSPAKPDVRRRFRQNDMLGKAVAEVAERSIAYCADAYDLDNCIKQDVLDSLLPGRGISRVRYVAKVNEVAQPQVTAPVSGSRIKAGFFPSDKQKPEPAEGEESGDEYEGAREEVEYEQALCDHVQWDDYLQGPGKTWDEVPWNAYRHRLTKDDIAKKFGEEIANAVKLGEVSEPELEQESNKDIAGVFKRAEFWEIWDKDSKRVFFVSESYKKNLIFTIDSPAGEPPLKLKDFFSCPRPLMLVEDSGSLIPIPLYELYREQASELDTLSARINKIVKACRVRFVHDPTLSELKSLMDADDNIGIPAEQARAWMTNGGIEKAIWWMPIDTIAAVLKELYVARDAAKQVIYEITGISDIIRGDTDPRETLGAQKIKANSSSLRLQRMQREVQRYVRDLIRLLAEVIGEHFDQQTLASMTGLQFPTAIQKQQLQLQAQALQQAQQPMPPALQNALSMPSWEEVMGVLRSDMQREYRVDVETDSTVAQSLQQDMEGLREVVGGIVEFIQGVGPAVQSGAMSIEAAKAIVMTIARRARMGLEVEDALEQGFQQPKPQDSGEAAKAQAEQAKVAAQQQADQARLAHDQQVAANQQQAEERKAQAQAALDLHKEELISQREALKLEHEKQLELMRLTSAAQLEQMKVDAEQAFNKWKAELEARTKIEVAEIAAKTSLEGAQIDAAAKGAEGINGKPGPMAKAAEELTNTAKLIKDSHQEVIKHLSKPRKRKITTPDGRQYVSEDA